MRVATITAIGVAVAVLSLPIGPGLAVLIGWDVSGGTFLWWCWRDIKRMDADETARHAVQNDPSRATASALLLGAATASLLAVGDVVGRASHSAGWARGAQIALVTLSVMLSWTVVHMVYMLRYAHLYYLEPLGGVDFKQDGNPAYSDFAYMAFTVGMTFQVSDTDITAPRVRAAVLRHALLSYVFGTVILALMINLAAGLVR